MYIADAVTKIMWKKEEPTIHGYEYDVLDWMMRAHNGYEKASCFYSRLGQRTRREVKGVIFLLVLTRADQNLSEIYKGETSNGVCFTTGK